MKIPFWTRVKRWFGPGPQHGIEIPLNFDKWYLCGGEVIFNDLATTQYINDHAAEVMYYCEIDEDEELKYLCMAVDIIAVVKFWNEDEAALFALTYL